MFRHRVLFKVLGKLQLIEKKTGKQKDWAATSKGKRLLGALLYIVKM